VGIASGIGLLWNPWRRNPKAYRFSVAMPALPALRCPPVFHDPALDRRMVDRDPALLQQFLDMPIAQGVGHIPTHAHENNIWWEMSSLEANRHRYSPSLCTVGHRDRP